jgi:OTU domain-containing protein 6
VLYVCSAKIQALKHSVPKGDKKKKKAIAIDIAKLETEQEQRHKKETEELTTQTEV